MGVPRIHQSNNARGITTSIVVAAAVGIWLVVALLFDGNSNRSVTFVYADAVGRWFQQSPLYGTSGHGFLYPPQFVMAYAPFAWIPQPWGDLAWRAVGMALFVAGMIKWSSLLPGGRERLVLHLSAPALLLSLSSLRIGQATLPMTGLMLLGAAALAERRWNAAAAWLGVSLLVKPLSIVLVLLTVAAYRPMRGRMVGVVVGLLVLPFLFNAPLYVIDQYRGFWKMLGPAEQTGSADPFAHLFGMLQVWGLNVAAPVQRVARLAAALLVLVVCLRVRFTSGSRETAFWLYVGAAVYLMLFNPRSENSTYCILGPVLGICYAEALVVRKHLRTAAFLLILSILTAGSYEIGKFFTPAGAIPVWLAPLATTVFCGYLAIIRYPQRTRFEAAEIAVPEFPQTPLISNHKKAVAA